MLDARYTELAPTVRTFHCLTDAVTLYGEAETEPPAMHLARTLIQCTRTPQAPTRGPVQITFNTAGTEEVWTCRFPCHMMRLILSLHRGYFTERLGAARLFFSLEANHTVLRVHLEGLHFLDTPCPAWLRLAVLAERSGDDDRFHFNVHTSLSLLGMVATYQGYLDPTMMERE